MADRCSSLTYLPVLLSLALTLLLCFGKRAQFAIPLGFERVGYQPVGGIDAHVTAASQVRFVLGSLDLLETQPVCLLQSGLQFLLDGERDFQCNWTHGFNQ
jgi:hypothetical protein